MSSESVAVIDAGSCTFKADVTETLNSDDEPRVVYANAVTDTSAAEDRQSHVFRAIEDRAVVSWDAYESILDSILYRELKWQPGEEGALVVTEPLFTPRVEREELAQLLFEHNNLTALHVSSQAVLSLYAAGKLSGTVVDVGHTTVDIAAIMEGQLLVPNTRRLNFGMASVAQHLQRIMPPVAGLDDAALEMLRNAITRVADSREEFQGLIAKGNAAPCEKHELPDGQVIEVQTEGITAGEALVDGSRLGLQLPDTASAIYLTCHSNPDTATKKAVLENLVICGGGSATQGLPQRLLRELRLKLPPSVVPSLVQSPDYMKPDMLRFAAWMGGAILSKVVFQQPQVASQPTQYVSRAEYDEYGPPIVHKKFP